MPLPHTPPLFVHDADQRHDTTLRHGPVNTSALAGGIVTVLLAYGALILVAWVTHQVSQLDESEGAALPGEPDEPPTVHFVQAKLVKLGRQFDARELPNRLRDARTTAAQQPSEVPRHGARRVPRPDAGPMNAVDDLLTRLGNRADEHARIAYAAEQEGDPDGVEEGTATRDEGDLYRTYLVGFFRRGFQMPTSIPDDEARNLRATVQIQTSPGGTIEAGVIVRPSGNADFDQAVRLRVGQAVGSVLRDPPDDERAQYFGTRFPIAMRAPRR